MIRGVDRTISLL